MNRWNQFWFARVDALPLAIFRIGLGCLLLAMYLAATPNWERFYAADGIMSLNDADLNTQRQIDSEWLLAWTEGLLPVQTWWYVGLMLATCLILGWQTRLVSVALFIFESSLIQRNIYIVNGEELVTRMYLFYGCFAPWGARCSLDSWLRSRRPNTQPVQHPMVWSWRLMQINFCLIYLISLPYKFAQDIDWLNGDAMHWTIASDMWWTRGALPEITLSFNGWLRKAMTWGTVLVEGLFPLLVCFRKTKIPAVLSIMSLHLGIAWFVPGVTFFTLAMVVGALSFIPSETYVKCGQWLTTRLGKVFSTEPVFATQ